MCWIILGVSEPLRSKKELKRILKDNDNGFVYQGKHYTLYEGTQLKRNIELGLRKLKDKEVLTESSNVGDLEKIQNKRKLLKKKYKEVSLLLDMNTEVRI